MAKIYRGSLSPDGETRVTVSDGLDLPERPLPPRLDLRHLSPGGCFNWSFQGPAPSQLALAICADATGDDVRAVACYRDFMRKLIVQIKVDCWVLMEDAVQEVIRDIETARAQPDGFDVSDSPVEA